MGVNSQNEIQVLSDFNLERDLSKLMLETPALESLYFDLAQLCTAFGRKILENCLVQ